MMKTGLIVLALVAAIQLSYQEEIERADAEENFGVALNDDDFDDQIIGGRNHTNGRYTGRIVRLGKYIGNGVLVSRRHLLTSAQNIINPADDVEYESTEITVHLGFTSTNNAGRGYRAIRALSLVAHYDYLGRANNYAHNIGVITLRLPVRKNQLLAPITLPYTRVSPPVKRQVSVASWGQASVAGGLPTLLQIAKVRTVSQADFTKANPNAQVNENQLYLTSYEGTVVQTDSGAPLFYQRRLAGIVSHTQSRNSAVALDLKPYLAWFDEVTASE